MITLENDVLDFRFPEVHEAARCAIGFQRTLRIPGDDKDYPLPPFVDECPAPMGLAPGGRMKQEIYDDPYGLDAWDQRHASRCFVTIVNSAQWMAMTGERPPASPPTAKEYTGAGLPWFEYYGGDASAVAGAETLKALTSVAQMMKEKGKGSMPDSETVDVDRTVKLGNPRVRQVREGALFATM